MLYIYLTSVNEYRKKTEDVLLDECLERISRKDKSALTELYNITSTSVYSFALSILKNTYDAEDVLHDCYVNIYLSAENYHSKGKPMAWILTITKNLCLLKIRDQKRISDIPQEDWEKYLKGKDDMAQEDKIILYECMVNLSDEERQIVILHAVAGLKHREIAKTLSIPLSTVLSKYNRSLKKLKDLLMKGEWQL